MSRAIPCVTCWAIWIKYQFKVASSSALEGKRHCFAIFYDVNMRPKTKTDLEFSLVLLSEIQ